MNGPQGKTRPAWDAEQPMGQRPIEKGDIAAKENSARCLKHGIDDPVIVEGAGVQDEYQSDR